MPRYPFPESSPERNPGAQAELLNANYIQTKVDQFLAAVSRGPKRSLLSWLTQWPLRPRYYQQWTEALTAHDAQVIMLTVATTHRWRYEVWQPQQNPVAPIASWSYSGGFTEPVKHGHRFEHYLTSFDVVNAVDLVSIMKDNITGA